MRARAARVTRRAALGLGSAAALVAAAAPEALAHTPYRQWAVYRRKHLLIGAHRDDGLGYALAKTTAERLVEHLPTSRARVARAPAAHRLAGLLATDQLDLAVLRDREAVAMAGGSGAFSSTGSVDLVALAPLPGGYGLYAHARFRDEHASLVAEALGVGALGASASRPLPWHKAVGGS